MQIKKRNWKNGLKKTKKQKQKIIGFTKKYNSKMKKEIKFDLLSVKLTIEEISNFLKQEKRLSIMLP